MHLAETNALRRATAESTGACTAFDPVATPATESGFDVVIDAVGGRVTREASLKAVRPGGTVIHIGLMDNDGGMDARKLTLQEITFIGTYTYTPVDLRVSLRKLHSGAFGDLAWIEQRPLSEGAGAFEDLLHVRTSAPKIILVP